jgi:hypothetical protein
VIIARDRTIFGMLPSHDRTLRAQPHGSLYVGSATGLVWWLDPLGHIDSAAGSDSSHRIYVNWTIRGGAEVLGLVS